MPDAAVGTAFLFDDEGTSLGEGILVSRVYATQRATLGITGWGHEIFAGEGRCHRLAARVLRELEAV